MVPSIDKVGGRERRKEGYASRHGFRFFVPVSPSREIVNKAKLSHMRGVYGGSSITKRGLNNDVDSEHERKVGEREREEVRFGPIVCWHRMCRSIPQSRLVHPTRR